MHHFLHRDVPLDEMDIGLEPLSYGETDYYVATHQKNAIVIKWNHRYTVILTFLLCFCFCSAHGIVFEQTQNKNKTNTGTSVVGSVA